MIEIILAIDIIEGKAVRLTQGDYKQKKIYNQDPLEVAKKFEDYGIRRLHLVDLDGAKANFIVNYKILERIASHTSLIIDFSGGLKSDSDLKIAFNSGAKMVTGGSIAVKNPKIFKNWINKFGANCILLGADCRNNKIAVNGWTEETNEEILPFIKKWRKYGITKVICTDISKDGMLKGTSTELYKTIKKEDTSIYLIASGGVSCIYDIDMLQEAGLSGVIIGKAIYESKIQLKELKKYAC
ncbi:MAG: 1-(5-phosphoribosyl)-5-[(5-phosphoribosylamino) me thylideneamino]imidazole-4-carboxamide isomerase [Candidatus Azobacteroides pseudotrichonymphae]|jgi:phosphoribosylformimino-5-aminoimidazole carboxamide ribotide isomerase|uniref:1-(5-phosphoribosyl)-5-[(5-phosphoribosylamino)methylideneamino] imidazole-4-carboxamide isomerase n=1 Tax=Azobacteroides pseudotrichonymphae genomovar. CFP2 TaxID=511995 RepID=HIS4_AZOPC|nr:1-(5-phosphoribosyl)-5-[(5-phosphoribosylamino)methylideneamino]imidazole-4-carboxamide isomerase [Candidatus Azobacteroides pseudotrichonymphae]B6YQ29.1 RecName: Full=1-(5-phosphoribosyl)-5-[(5-phosphoribosylamino)methylideneamino] imidazole-4-carboxamide isomerase; AltName: Full=Phosphoribosylformimino-5-aminoimidazole carboxamide ribotide isomerase [Candidatus Azobacteroides pseudotrichonymphae genomovar. CFP2]MDR0530066.1 1-(5-phosphoribosyl)-5-[(5-phosphoribosylamino)methylideneamino]imid